MLTLPEAHAKGILLTGTFTPTSEAAKLSSAPHFNAPSTPISVRFSNSTGIPQIPDTDPNADPRGMAIRFHLGGRSHTDIVAHSTPFFPTRTGAEFLELLKAIASGDPMPFLGEHPAAMAFVQAPKPPPSSYARDTYFGVTAFKFVSVQDKTQAFRYQIKPVEGNDFISAEAVKEKSPSYLHDEIVERVKSSGASFKVYAQLAEEGDKLDDATVHWPESRTVVELGSVKIDGVADNEEHEQKVVIMDPIPRVKGIEPTDDPLLEMRAAVYLISGRQRRAAAKAEANAMPEVSETAKVVG